MSFSRSWRSATTAPGDFAQAYMWRIEGRHMCRNSRHLGAGPRGAKTARDARATDAGADGIGRLTALPGVWAPPRSQTAADSGARRYRGSARGAAGVRRPSAETERAGLWCPIPSPTVRRSNGCAGSAAACKARSWPVRHLQGGKGVGRSRAMQLWVDADACPAVIKDILFAG